MIAFPEPDAILEASGDSVLRRSQRASRAGVDVVKDRLAEERQAAAKLKTRLGQLQAALSRRLLADDGSVTDFRRFALNSLLHDVDRLVTDVQADIAREAARAYSRVTELGDRAAEEPLRAAQLGIRPALPGMDRHLVTAAFDNTVELLTQPMAQFASSIKVLLRGVALSGDQRMEAIQRLRDQIQGAGFDNAQYRAERIIRTELGRTFNQATFDRLLGLSKDFPFLRKGWRAAGDTRTRTGHREAARTYARGSGIPIGQPFKINAYRERPGKTPVLLGVADLRFPIDPQGTPAGPVTAAATILCRCNAFVDFDLADFAEFSRRQIQFALGGALPPVAPGPVAVPKPFNPANPFGTGEQIAYYQGRYYGTRDQIERLMKLLGRGTIGQAKRGFYLQDGAQFFGPKGWAEVAAKAVKPAPVAPVVPKAMGATVGPKVSDSLVPTLVTKKLAAVFDTVTAAIDGVHSDGLLKKIPLGPMSGKAYGEFSYKMTGPLAIRVNSSAMKAHPFNTLAHEIGHWLDNAAVGRLDGFYRAGSVIPRAFGQMNTDFITGSPLMEAWLDAVKSSDTIQRLQTWRGASSRQVDTPILFRGQPIKYTGYEGDGVIPKGLNQKHIAYLMQKQEIWARAYAQYVAVRSGDAAMMTELRDMQRRSASGPVPATHQYNFKTAGVVPDTWTYPIVWQDDEFKPIAEAFDRIFEAMGWRNR